MDNMQINTEYNSKQMPKELQDFNWGAFLLTFIWGIKYKAWITFLAIPLFFIQMPLGLNWLLLVLFQLYCGIKGNEWAYKQEYWKKPKEFRVTQMKWAAVALAINIIIPMILLSITAKFLKKPENVQSYIHNSQCTTTYKKLKSGIKTIHYTPQTTGDQLAQQFAKNFAKSSVTSNYIEIKEDKDSKNKRTHTVYFNKFGENDYCTLLDQNCQIHSTMSIFGDYGYSYDCIYYFDENRRIKPDQATAEAIRKGTNILNYL